MKTKVKATRLRDKLNQSIHLSFKSNGIHNVTNVYLRGLEMTGIIRINGIKIKVKSIGNCWTQAA